MTPDDAPSAEKRAATPGPGVDPGPTTTEKSDRLGRWLFVAAVVLYAATRLISLEAFPIYFFCDEAAHSVAFRELVDNGFYSNEPPHEFLPAYFRNARMINLSLSVYLQGIASYIGGQNIFTVRATSAIVSLLGAVALALLLRRIFRVREWWSAVAFLAVMPGLFLHARTGFECVIMFAAYCWFLYFYLLYREESPRYVVGVVFFGAATFYSYVPGQGLMLATGILLGLLDLRYHVRHWRWALVGAGLALLFFAPYLRFRSLHPTMASDHLAEVRSYWVKPIPLSEKLAAFGQNYLAGFSPHYWFKSESPEKIVRHIVPFNGYIPWSLAPFALLGLAMSLVHWRRARDRVLLAAALASGFSGALASPGVTRNITFMASTALFAAIGFDWAMRGLREGRGKAGVRVTSFALLACAGVVLLHDALAFGATRFHNYGLGSLQWGAQAIYRDLIPRYLPGNPLANIFVSHVWSNNPDVFPRFFGWYDARRVHFLALDHVDNGSILPEERDLVVLTAPEYDSLPSRRNVASFEVLEKVPWPDGRIGFYLGHLRLRPGFAQEMRAMPGYHRLPEFVRMEVGGVPASVAIVGVENGGEEDLFSSTPHPEIATGVGGSMRVAVFFDHPVALQSVEILMSDELPKHHTFIAMLKNQVVTEERDGISTRASTFMIPMMDREVDYLFFELAGASNQPIRVKQIGVTPVAPEAVKPSPGG